MTISILTRARDGHLARAASIKSRLAAMLGLARTNSDTGRVGNLIFDCRALCADLDAALNEAFTACVRISQLETERDYGPLISDLQQMIATAEPVANDREI